MKSLFIAAVAMAGLSSFTAERANAQASTGETSSHVLPAKLENSDVLDMVKAGLPEEVILAKIQGSPCNFDTSPAALATLKSAQVPNAVILAVVKKSNQTNSSEERDASSSSTRSATPSPTPEATKASVQQPAKGCMAVKPIGSHAFRNYMLLGVAGVLISHQQYEVVDVIDYPSRVGQKYHGNDLQTIQSSGTRVVLLEKHYTAEDLHKACHQQ
jgi:hypothetical protein